MSLDPKQIAAIQSTGMKRALKDAWRRMAEAEGSGRATFSKAQAAVVLEIANAAFRQGVEVEADMIQAEMGEQFPVHPYHASHLRLVTSQN